jgi:hypothetical protein
VWINGPFACGLFNDLAIVHMGLKQQLGDKEHVEVDDGYSGDNPSHVKTRSGVYHLEGGHNIQNSVCSRHKTVNKQMKQFGALSNVECVLT